jgi:FkbM family methyltransferase
MIRQYIQIVRVAINIFEQVFFWPPTGKFLKSTIMAKHLDPSSLVIVDVGVNRGQSTILFLKWFPKAKIYGFEPLPDAFIIAKKRLAERAQLYNLGVSSMSGVRTFWQAKLDETSTFDKPNLESNYHKMKSKVLLSSVDTMYKALTVNTISLCDFTSKEKIDRIDLLKVDTEGHELEVLKGATTLLKQKQINLIQIERQETGLRSIEGALGRPEGVEEFMNAFSYYKVKTVSHVFARVYDDFYISKPE